MKLAVLLVALALIEGSWSACPHKLTTGGFRDVDGCFANRMFFPLCGDDDCTYINQGLLDCVNDNNRKDGRAEVNVVYSGMCRDAGSAGSNTNNNAAGSGAGGGSQQAVTVTTPASSTTTTNATGDGSIDLLPPAKFSTTQSPNNRHLTESPQVQRHNVQGGTRITSRTNVPSSGCSLTSSSILVQATEILSKMSMKTAKEYFKISSYTHASVETVTLPEMITTSDKEQNIVQSVVAVLLVTAMTMVI